MTPWATERKTALTPQEVIIVAHAGLIIGIDQQVLASMYGVNQARINEVLKVARWMGDHHKKIYRKLRAAEKLEKKRGRPLSVDEQLAIDADKTEEP
jgi:hypothetical protein